MDSSAEVIAVLLCVIERVALLDVRSQFATLSCDYFDAKDGNSKNVPRCLSNAKARRIVRFMLQYSTPNEKRFGNFDSIIIVSSE